MDQLTQTMIRCAFAVSSTLGCGFLEKVYENAPVHGLRKAGMRVHPRFHIAGTTSG